MRSGTDGLSQAEDLAADVRAELGTRARLVVKPWGMGS